MAGGLQLGAVPMKKDRYPALREIPAPLLAIITDLPPNGASHLRPE